MKTIKILGICAMASMLLVSCKQEMDIWYSETAQYDGRYVYGVFAEDGTEYAGTEYGYELYIYNTAANIANEIWINDKKGLLAALGAVAFQGKCKLNGDASSFATSENAKNVKWNDDIVAISKDPTAANQEGIGLYYYTAFAISNGQIIKNGATTPGGNTSDSICMKITFKSDTVKLVSVDNGDGTFDWSIDETTLGYNANYDETYWLKGYRYTGFPEDL